MLRIQRRDEAKRIGKSKAGSKDKTMDEVHAAESISQHSSSSSSSAASVNAHVAVVIEKEKEGVNQAKGKARVSHRAEFVPLFTPLSLLFIPSASVPHAKSNSAGTSLSCSHCPSLSSCMSSQSIEG